MWSSASSTSCRPGAAVRRGRRSSLRARGCDASAERSTDLRVDAQIAAICLAVGARLATSNVHDFDGLGVEVIDPWDRDQV